MHAYSIGAASLPTEGMGAVSKQLGDSLQPSQLLIHTAATSLDKGEVYASTETDGTDPTHYKFTCEHIVVATDPKTAQDLLGKDMCMRVCICVCSYLLIYTTYEFHIYFSVNRKRIFHPSGTIVIMHVLQYGWSTTSNFSYPHNKW